MLERKCEEEAAGRATRKVCTVEAFEGTAAHYALEQRITISCWSLLTSPLYCSGAVRLTLEHSNTTCDNQLAEH